MECRCEIKFPLRTDEWMRLHAWLRGDGQHFHRAHPGRRVNSLYFDAPDYMNYFDNQDGHLARTKSRLRWYGDRTLPKEIFFEMKMRQNHVIFKQKHGFAARELPLLPLPTLASRIRKLLPAELKARSAALHRPTVVNRYWREYFCSRDGIRLTVDTRLEQSALLHTSRISTRFHRCGLAAVCEVKYPPALHERMVDYLHTFPFRVDKNSKYTNALDGI